MHYGIHKPEPHILLFRRPIGTNSRTGKAPKNWKTPEDLTEQRRTLSVLGSNSMNGLRSKRQRARAAISDS